MGPEGCSSPALVRVFFFATRCLRKREKCAGGTHSLHKGGKARRFVGHIILVMSDWNGGADGRFPSTRLSVIVAARSEDTGVRQQALDRIAAVYWKPVYKYIRLHWLKSKEDAQDLTQEFFARVIEKDFLAGYDPERARLRTFLRTCVDALVANEARAARRLKRGGGAAVLPLDFQLAEHELSPLAQSASGNPDELFEREWVRSLFSLAVEELQRACEKRGKLSHFRLFERYDLEDSEERRLSYRDLALEFGLEVTDVTNYLAYVRREFRRIALDLLREMTANEEEFRREARALFGVEAE